MTVTVVKGFIPKGASEPTQTREITLGRPQAQNLASAPAQAAVSSVAANSGDAAVAVLRLSKTSSASDKVRDDREAKKLATEVAEKIRDEEKSLDTHSELNAVTARQHFG
jgi:hypothetical protein